MSLFQQTVVKKYLNEINEDSLQLSWQKFQTNFHNTIKQQNIRNAKEEQYQEGFFHELFVDVLGYTLNPQPKFNLTTEYKNEKDSKKADGAILIGEQVLAVIELKGTDTTDLNKVENQAFSYKNNQKDCTYIITSNFEKLRFYINDATEYEEFNIFTLTKSQFSLLYLCLQKDNLTSHIPLQIKQASIAVEENITRKLYFDYSTFKKKLYYNIIELNPQHDKLLLFKKTQKLLDRFLFIFFAEDRLLLPPNSVREILKQWQQLKELDNYVPLYERFKKYFGYLNTGHEGKLYQIFAYNGGLFAADDFLDNLLIDDETLYQNCITLSNYNFDTEVDVNILGHIFEHSLNELEELQAELEGTKIARSKTKRKKDGVFYTPRYITKYIVENTIGSLCEKKKIELSIKEVDFVARKYKTDDADDKRKKKLLDILNDYRQWLLQLTICDPACGSGAFLNQALDFLLTEHRFVDELKAKLFGDSIIYSDVEKEILENNLFGVDINEEATEIARLSLWLRTAQKGRKLNNLSNNIKCGNSLIDDISLEGDKAFSWNSEFPHVFQKGGFDVIIGNPPYLRVQGLHENFELESVYYQQKYKTATGRFDIYVLFLEKAFQLINVNGRVSFILPHKFMISDFGVGIRKFMFENKAISSILNFGANMVFEDASTYTCIINLGHGNTCIFYKEINPLNISMPFEFDKIEYSTLNEDKWNMQSKRGSSLFEKLSNLPFTAKDIFENISQGLVSVGDDIFVLSGTINKEIFSGFSEQLGTKIELEASLMKPLLKGDDVKKYAPLKITNYSIYPHYEKNGKTVPYEEDDFKMKFPLGFAYLLNFKKELIDRIRYLNLEDKIKVCY